ncbi:MAG: phosphohydrolase [candidate division NC10 bacterium]|nr:phosphohydrolase [candidate division NC10 bacterium]
MASMEELREGVRKCLPELANIKDEELRDRVVEGWAFSLSKTEFSSIDDMKASGGPNTPAVKNAAQSHHLRGVAWAAQGIADGLEKVHGDIGINRDLLWACSLCHDLGKPFEYSPKNQERWQANIAASGYPAIRHTVYGVHVALTVGLPEAVAHAAGAHSMEGEFVKRSLENTIVHFADHAYWYVLDRARLLDGQMFDK